MARFAARRLHIRSQAFEFTRVYYIQTLAFSVKSSVDFMHVRICDDILRTVLECPASTLTAPAPRHKAANAGKTPRPDLARVSGRSQSQGTGLSSSSPHIPAFTRAARTRKTAVARRPASPGQKTEGLYPKVSPLLPTPNRPRPHSPPLRQGLRGAGRSHPSLTAPPPPPRLCPYGPSRQPPASRPARPTSLL